ncbi:MAG: sugar transferase [Acidobacteria bacterium]|nr:MAG: sugar transferase [Acidobacteriota bacterium]
MFRRRYQTYAKLMLVADLAAGLLALYLSYHLRSYLVVLTPEAWSRLFNPELLPFSDYFVFFLAFLPCWVLLLTMTQRYPQLLEVSLTQQFLRIAQFVLVTAFAAGFLSYFFKLVISRPVLLTLLVLVGLFQCLIRLFFYWLLWRRNLSEHNRVNIVIIGANGRAEVMAKLLGKMRAWGYRVEGYVSTRPDEPELPDLPRLGALEDLQTILQQREGVDEVVFVGSDVRDLEDFEDLIAFCEDLGVRTRLALDFFPTTTSRVSLDFLEHVPLLTFATAPDHDMSLIAKRVADFVIALTSLICLSPLLLLVAAAVKFTSPGPVFYRQMRCGLYGRRFRLVKFRTMMDGAEDKLWEIRHLNEMDGPVFKMRNDPRVTPLGRILRKSSLDELPQLWNVLKGQMSIVGPRAPLPEEVRYYATKQKRRLSVKPGITCLWQVSGRSDIDFHRWMEMDLEYIDNWSFWLDVVIMLKTIPAVFTGRGAR